MFTSGPKNARDMRFRGNFYLRRNCYYMSCFSKKNNNFTLMFKQMLRPRPFAGAFQHALRSRWSPIAPLSRIDHRLAAFELAEKDFARRLTALTLTFIFKQALS